MHIINDRAKEHDLQKKMDWENRISAYQEKVKSDILKILTQMYVCLQMTVKYCRIIKNLRW